jgi:hypothetical protein
MKQKSERRFLRERLPEAARNEYHGAFRKLINRKAQRKSAETFLGGLRKITFILQKAVWLF